MYLEICVKNVFVEINSLKYLNLFTREMERRNP